MPRLFYSRHEERKTGCVSTKKRQAPQRRPLFDELRDGGAQGCQELRLRRHRIQPYAFANKSKSMYKVGNSTSSILRAHRATRHCRQVSTRELRSTLKPTRYGSAA